MPSQSPVPPFVPHASRREAQNSAGSAEMHGAVEFVVMFHPVGAVQAITQNTGQATSDHKRPGRLTIRSIIEGWADISSTSRCTLSWGVLSNCHLLLLGVIFHPVTKRGTASLPTVETGGLCCIVLTDEDPSSPEGTRRHSPPTSSGGRSGIHDRVINHTCCYSPSVSR